jgi:hypothetical protein
MRYVFSIFLVACIVATSAKAGDDVKGNGQRNQGGMPRGNQGGNPPSGGNSGGVQASSSSDSNSNSKSSSNSTSTSSATSNPTSTSGAAINYQAPRDFIGAVPGAIGSLPIPGIPMVSEPWQPYCPVSEMTWTTEQIELAKRQFHGKKQMKTVILNENAVLPNNDPIQIVCWLPEAIMHDGDQVIARTSLKECHDLPEPCMAVAFDDLKKGSHTRRVAIEVQIGHATNTHGLSIGPGGSGAAQPGNGNYGAGVAVGGMIGKITTRTDEFKNFQVIALNDGPFKPPVLAVPPSQAQQPPTFLPPPPQVVKIEMSPIPPIKIEFEVKQPPISLMPIPSPRELRSPVPAPHAEEVCDAQPDFTIFFDFGASIVKNEYLPKIREFVRWLNAHPKCQIEIVGQTCKSGPYHFDAGLGLLRAKAVYDLLISRGGNREQLVRFTSTGKEFPVSEYDEKNRRASANVFKPVSGK